MHRRGVVQCGGSGSIRVRAPGQRAVGHLPVVYRNLRPGLMVFAAQRDLVRSRLPCLPCFRMGRFRVGMCEAAPKTRHRTGCDDRHGADHGFKVPPRRVGECFNHLLLRKLMECQDRIFGDGYRTSLPLHAQGKKSIGIIRHPAGPALHATRCGIFQHHPVCDLPYPNDANRETCVTLDRSRSNLL